MCHVVLLSFVSLVLPKPFLFLYEDLCFSKEKELPSVLRAAPLSKLVVQMTCSSCHASLIGQAGLEHGGGVCVRCHSDVGHEHH
jgi:hypothetical protein